MLPRLRHHGRDATGPHARAHAGAAGSMGHSPVATSRAAVALARGGHWCPVVAEGSFLDGGAELKWLEAFALTLALALIDSSAGRSILRVRF